MLGSNYPPATKSASLPYLLCIQGFVRQARNTISMPDLSFITVDFEVGMIATAYCAASY
jgi:hypothetical protein